MDEKGMIQMTNEFNFNNTNLKLFLTNREFKKVRLI